MLTVTRILTNTPLWVFALLAYLIWQGSQSLRPRTLPIWRMLIVPLVFFLMGVSRLVTARDRGIEPLLAWLVAAVLFALLALSLRPKLLAVDRKSGTVTRPGSATPLARNITVFMLQYAVAVATAMKLEPHAAVAIIGHAVSGASAGFFFGPGGGAGAPLQEFRRGRKFRRRTRDRWRVEPPRYAGDFLVEDFSVRSPPVLCTLERGSARPGRTTAGKGK